jgi:ribosomal protein L44E
LTQHFTRSTVSAEFYCSKCGKPTQHRIDGVKKGPCLECMAELERQHKITEAIQRARQLEATQIDLFPGIL